MTRSRDDACEHASDAERAESVKKAALGPRLSLVPVPRQEGGAGTSTPAIGDHLL